MVYGGGIILPKISNLVQKINLSPNLSPLGQFALKSAFVAGTYTFASNNLKKKILKLLKKLHLLIFMDLVMV